MGTFSCAQVDLQKAREREFATLDEKCRGAVELLTPMSDKNWRQEPGGRRNDPPVTTACQEADKVLVREQYGKNENTLWSQL